ncbi:MAG: fibronectin type III domain-containing protein [Pirellulales bacterium]|nr:fibronectin type III domain-containing protein [Pirellulales bacterium]
MMRFSLSVSVALLLAAAAAGVERVGFHEDFSRAEGWEISKWPGITGLESVTSDGRQATFTTLAGTFMVGASAAWAPDWPDWDKHAPAGLAIVVKKYPAAVDLDRYHFLVARMTHSGTYMALAVNGWDTKVCYTTGLHAVDLRDVQKPSLRGRQPVELRLTFLNTGAKVALDDVRLVDALSPEEQAGFIPAGLDLRLERQEPKPYHALEALNARAGGPIRFDLPEERAVFRDTSTGAVVWKLTRGIRTELADHFNPNGSALPIYNRSSKGMVIYDFTKGGLRELSGLQGSPVFSRDDPAVMYVLQSAESGGQAHYVVRAVDFRTGAATDVADWTSGDSGGAEFVASTFSDRLALGLKEGRAVFLIDPKEPEPSRRVRRVPLPMRMKGISLSHNDDCVNWQRCYYFQPWQMDLRTGEVRLRHYPTYGGHEIFGRDWVVGRYGTMMLAHRAGLLPCDESRAGDVRIWSNWATDVPSDYGRLSDDDRWLATNGTEGAVAGKRLLIDGQETGTVLQVVHDFTSRNSWDSNTYTRVSPDATKIAYMCDMLGDTDVYVALARRPEAPRNLTLQRDGPQVRLRWDAPPAAREIAGYNVYRSRESGRGYQRVNRERIAKTDYVDTPPAGPAFYAVAAEEHSGLEGLYSKEAQTEAVGPCRVYADLEEGELSPPLRQHLDGQCSNFRCARVWKEAPAETTGQATLKLRVPAPGTYHLWMRGRGQGQFLCSTADQSATGRIDSDRWAWTRVETPLRLSGGPQQLILRSSDDGLSLDLAMLTSAPTDRPDRLDDRDPVPAPVGGLRATEVSSDQVRLAWTPSADPDLDGYSVYVGAEADFLAGNASLLASGRSTECLDWGLTPGATLYYKVVAFNKRGAESTPTTIRVETPKMASDSVELTIGDATLSGGLIKQESRGVVSAFLPAPLGENGPRPAAMWEFNVPHDGVYYVWARYTTLDAKRVSLFWIDCDGRDPLRGANWRLRFPCTLTRHLDGVTPGEETWFTDKMASGWWAGPIDALTLKAGRHSLSVAFEPTHAPRGPRLAAVYLSNAPSYRAPGFDPRVDFRK